VKTCPTSIRCGRSFGAVRPASGAVGLQLGVPADLEALLREPLVERIDGFGATRTSRRPDHGVGEGNAVRRPTEEKRVNDRALVQMERGDVAPLQKAHEPVDHGIP